MATQVSGDGWTIVENGLHTGPENEVFESIFSLSNGHMGVRGFFEEKFSSENSLQGTYVGGVFFPDKTVVGWWKHGYPDHYDKTVNSPSFLSLDVAVNGSVLDLATWDVDVFKRSLDMKKGVLDRTFTASCSTGKVKVDAKRFCSMEGWDKKGDDSYLEIAAVSYTIHSLEDDAEIKINSVVDGDVYNRTAGGVFGHAVGSDTAVPRFSFWEHVNQCVGEPSTVVLRTKKPWYKRRNEYWREQVGEEIGVPQFTVATSLHTSVTLDSSEIKPSSDICDDKGIVGHTYVVTVPKGKSVVVTKYVAVTSSRDHQGSEKEEAERRVMIAAKMGFDRLLDGHIRAWEDIWLRSDIQIEGDDAAQQGIRFNIFHLKQTYTGHDDRLNIGPKGFTGEVYGGATYWDTEAYCLPFVLSTADPSIARQLLVYRHKQLGGARHNAANMGLDGALYPMVTVTGEECHNEWEITFEEIHRNAAIPYGIYAYVRYTGDTEYVDEMGYEVLVETCRFWASRVFYNPKQKAYVMHGVTGPNEYEHNVNNNYYTNRMAKWNLEYTLHVTSRMTSDILQKWKDKMKISDDELSKWSEIAEKIFVSQNDEHIFEQHEGYFNKEDLTVADLKESDMPLKMHWTWDKVLRSPFIKQADTLQALYFLNHTYTRSEKLANFNYYEPRTVHDSSLSPSVHTILAAELELIDKAHEMYLRSARLDLENVDRDTGDGLHITAMAGTWLAVVHGFGGLRVSDDGVLSLSPSVPSSWQALTFNLVWRGAIVQIRATNTKVTLSVVTGDDAHLVVWGKSVDVKRGEVREVGK